MPLAAQDRCRCPSTDRTACSMWTAAAEMCVAQTGSACLAKEKAREKEKEKEREKEKEKEREKEREREKAKEIAAPPWTATTQSAVPTTPAKKASVACGSLTTSDADLARSVAQRPAVGWLHKPV